MNDKELADAVVAAYPDFDGPCGLRNRVSDKFFVTDWRVAGALMEKVDSTYPEKLIDGDWQVQASVNAMPTEWIVDNSLPRAIIEACCEALSA